MSVELAVCFLDRAIHLETIVQTTAAQERDADQVYMVMGTGRPESANKPFFALWSDGTVDIHALCLELSTRVSPTYSNDICPD